MSKYVYCALSLPLVTERFEDENLIKGLHQAQPNSILVILQFLLETGIHKNFGCHLPVYLFVISSEHLQYNLWSLTFLWLGIQE